MIELMLFILSVIGMTNIIVDGSIFQEKREKLEKKSPFWGQVVRCHQCCGFWCGLICGFFILIIDIPQQNLLWSLIIIPLKTFLFGCAGSFLAPAYDLFYQFILSKIEFTPPNDETT